MKTKKKPKRTPKKKVKVTEGLTPTPEAKKVHGVIKCRYDELVAISDLRAHPKNPNKHPEKQLDAYGKIMRKNGVREPVRVSNQSGFVTKGHGQILSAGREGWTHVPVEYQDYLGEDGQHNEDLEYADMVADNELAKRAELDLAMVNQEIPNLGPDFDMDILGIEDFGIDPSDRGEDAESLYTKKIEAPIYAPTGEKPKAIDLVDMTKHTELLEELRQAEIPEDVRAFLTLAATRHIVFDYAKIAEFYAHAPKEIQELMENSALVIIDFKKAIEKGFVTVSNEIAKAYADA